METTGTTALSVLGHAEVAHDVRIIHVVFEMIVGRSSASIRQSRRQNRRGGGRGSEGSGSADPRRVEVYCTGAEEVHWVMAPGGWRTLRAAPTVTKGKGREARLEADIAYEASGFRQPNTTSGAGGPSGPSGQGPRLNSQQHGSQQHGMNQGRHSFSAPALEPSLNIRRQARSSHHSFSHQKIHLSTATMHAASGSGLPRRKAFGAPTSAHPGSSRVGSKLLGASSLDQIIFLKNSSDLNNEGIIFGRVGDGGGGGGHAGGGGGSSGGNLLQGGMLTNIRVAGRDGKDALHVQLSTELRKAQNLYQQQQHKIDLLVAKEEEHLSKISGLEAAHGRLRTLLSFYSQYIIYYLIFF